MIIRISNQTRSNEELYVEEKLKNFLNFKISFATVILVLMAIICIGFLIIAFYAPLVAAEFKDNSSDFYQASANIASTLYNSMSPFIAIVAALLTFIAFWVQHEANEKMLKNHERQEVERQFYEMLRIHKENVNELKWSRWSLAESSNPKCICENDFIERGKFFYNNKYAFKPIMGREVFEYLFAEFWIIEMCLNRAIETANKSSLLNFSSRNVEDYRALLCLAYEILYEGDLFIKSFFKKKSYFFFDACERKFEWMKKIYDQGECFNFNFKKICLRKKIFYLMMAKG